jgi:hypothetical protein
MAEPTLKRAQDWLRIEVMTNGGAKCPCCRQFAKIYDRTITSAMAHDLILAWRLHGHEPFYAPDLTSKGARGHDIALLREWGLLEAQAEPARDDGTKRNGWWRITSQGAEFLAARLTVPKYAPMYNGKCQGLKGQPIDIVDALNNKFDYTQLMRGSTSE